jgi:hypothetical protein
MRDHELPGTGGRGRIKTRLVFSERSDQKQLILYWYNIGPYTTGHEQQAHFYTGYDAIFGHYNDVFKMMISIEYSSPDEVNAAVQQLEHFVAEFLIPFNDMVSKSSRSGKTSEKSSSLLLERTHGAIAG